MALEPTTYDLTSNNIIDIDSHELKMLGEIQYIQEKNPTKNQLILDKFITLDLWFMEVLSALLFLIFFFITYQEIRVGFQISLFAF